MTREEALMIDCVEKERLLKIYENRFFELQKLKQLKENKGAEDRQLGVNYCINILREMPIVTPQPKMGHWIEVTNGRGGHECDLCHEYAPSYQNGDEYLSKHCPNCGAKMQAESEKLK